MTSSFSKRVTVRIISFSAAAALLLAGAGMGGYKMMSRYRDSSEYRYQLALNNLSDYVSNIKTSLEKSLYSNTPAQQQPIFAKLMTMSEGAKNSLSQLPISGEQAVSIQKYLAQVGDYSFYALSKIAKNNKLSPDETDNLKTFYDYACELDTSIGDLAAAYGDGSVKLGSAVSLKGNISSIGEKADDLTLDGAFREMSEGFTDYPTMIYDGPFSDHIEQQKPKLLKDEQQISMEQALTVAAKFIGCNENELSFTGKTEGNLPTYNFAGDNIYITVTQKGGFVVLYNNYSDIAKTTLAYDDALKEAKKLLLNITKENFAESYYSFENNICTINFAYTQNDTIYYSDLIKVGVSMQTGEIVSYCASGYIMNHTKRELSTPTLSPDEAQNSLSDKLKVQSCKLALIPTAGKNEVLTYEFNCTAGEETVLVYINCDTGLEEQLYIVITDDNGVLVV